MGIKKVVFSWSTCTEEALFLVLNRASTPQPLLSSHWSHSGRGNRNKSQIQSMHAVTTVLCTQLGSCTCEFAVVVTACQRPVPSSSVTTVPAWNGEVIRQLHLYLGSYLQSQVITAGRGRVSFLLRI